MPQMGSFDKCTAATGKEELVLMLLGVYAAPETRRDPPEGHGRGNILAAASHKSSGEGPGRGAASFPDSPST